MGIYIQLGIRHCASQATGQDVAERTLTAAVQKGNHHGATITGAIPQALTCGDPTRGNLTTTIW